MALRRRVANLLRAKRGRRPRALLALRAGSGLPSRRLRALERAEASASPAELATLGEVYGFALADLEPERIALEIDAGAAKLTTAGVEARFDPEDEDSLLVEYLRLVRALRHEPHEPTILLRRGDIESLAGYLRTDGTVVIDRLGALMGSTVQQRRVATVAFAAGATIIMLGAGAAAVTPDDALQESSGGAEASSSEPVEAAPLGGAWGGPAPDALSGSDAVADDLLDAGEGPDDGAQPDGGADPTGGGRLDAAQGGALTGSGGDGEAAGDAGGTPAPGGEADEAEDADDAADADDVAEAGRGDGGSGDDADDAGADGGDDVEGSDGDEGSDDSGEGPGDDTDDGGFGDGEDVDGGSDDGGSVDGDDTDDGDSGGGEDTDGGSGGDGSGGDGSGGGEDTGSGGSGGDDSDEGGSDGGDDSDEGGSDGGDDSDEGSEGDEGSGDSSESSGDGGSDDGNASEDDGGSGDGDDSDDGETEAAPLDDLTLQVVPDGDGGLQAVIDNPNDRPVEYTLRINNSRINWSPEPVTVPAGQTVVALPFANGSGASYWDEGPATVALVWTGPDRNHGTSVTADWPADDADDDSSDEDAEQGPELTDVFEDDDGRYVYQLQNGNRDAGRQLFAGDGELITKGSLSLNNATFEGDRGPGKGWAITYGAPQPDDRIGTGYTLQIDPGFGNGEFVIRTWDERGAHDWRRTPQHTPFPEGFDPAHPSDLKASVANGFISLYVDGVQHLHYEMGTSAEDDAQLGEDGGVFGIRAWGDSPRVEFEQPLLEADPAADEDLDVDDDPSTADTDETGDGGGADDVEAGDGPEADDVVESLEPSDDDEPEADDVVDSPAQPDEGDDGNDEIGDAHTADAGDDDASVGDHPGQGQGLPSDGSHPGQGQGLPSDGSHPGQGQGGA